MNAESSHAPQELLPRLRSKLAALSPEEKRMFGGVTFMLNGNMLCCASKNGLMVRVGAEAEISALKLPYATPCDGAGHRMTGFVMIAPEGLKTERALDAALKLALDYVSGLPAKLPKAKATRPKLG